ncbi:uncharacterized protein [Macrobrachium rosenbergii]|uniref:uncharacterized protein n=1 Tax=Macrobrachium rosenbergii TaxID=79674 RepID=UPI0034D594ED
MACCTTEDWKYQLPWVLLGLITAPRVNGNPKAAEKIYGKPLVVQGELVMGDRHNPSAQRLPDIVGKFAPCQPTYTDRSTTFTPPSLSSTTHVFVRPYRGPFRVLERNTKAFRLALHGKDDWVSVDHLKPALLEETATSQNHSQPFPLTLHPPADFVELRHSPTSQQIPRLIRRYPRLGGGKYL